MDAVGVVVAGVEEAVGGGRVAGSAAATCTFLIGAVCGFAASFVDELAVADALSGAAWIAGVDRDGSEREAGSSEIASAQGTTKSADKRSKYRILI